MDDVSLNSEPAYDDEADEFEIGGQCEMTEYVGQSGVIQNPLPPAVGMEFESYDDVYYFYNCYAKEQGFGVRVSNTWYRKSRERYRGKLSCSSAGFKKKSEANRPRPETRTGCPAMIKFRLLETKRWRIIEVELEHNHLINQVSGRFYKSHKIIGAAAGTKRTWQPDAAEEVEKIRLFRTVIIDSEVDGTTEINEGEFDNYVDYSNRLKLRKGDAQAIHNYFCRMQLMNPNFFYLMDVNDKGCLRNVFWGDVRSKSAYAYFGDVVAIDNTCLANEYEVPLVAFIGTNHHRQPIILGCGLLSGETVDSYIWLFRAWLTFMLGRPPQAIITDHCKTLQAAVSDVFPRASHCFSLSHIMQKISQKLGGSLEYEAIGVALSGMVYYSLRADDFEAAWEDMIQRYGLGDHEWLKILHDDRKQWVPAYLKEMFLAGMFPIQQTESVPSIFEGYLHEHTPLREFFDKYDQAVLMNHQEEALADLVSRNESSGLLSRCYFELQLSKLYTNHIFKKSQQEVVGMHTCFSVRQMTADGPVLSYIVKDHVEVDENRREMRDYEVLYNTSEMEVHCICGLFNFRGYLCRHALNVLNQNGMEEIPPQYILSRWRKDIKRNYVLDHSCNGIDINNPVHRYDHLYKCVVKVVEEGRTTQDRYKVALQALDEILNRVRLVDDGPV